MGWEGIYEVSSHGRLRSLDRLLSGRAGFQRLHRGKLLKPKRNDFGYESYCLSKANSTSWRSIHVLVLEAFVGPRQMVPSVATTMETLPTTGWVISVGTLPPIIHATPSCTVPNDR